MVMANVETRRDENTFLRSGCNIRTVEHIFYEEQRDNGLYFIEIWGVRDSSRRGASKTFERVVDFRRPELSLTKKGRRCGRPRIRFRSGLEGGGSAAIPCTLPRQNSTDRSTGDLSRLDRTRRPGTWSQAQQARQELDRLDRQGPRQRLDGASTAAPGTARRDSQGSNIYR